MKLFTKVIAFALVLALAGPFLLKGPDGKPVYSLGEAWRSLQANAPSLELPEAVAPSEPVTVYRWRDASGQWHFSGEPPPEGESFDELLIDPNLNAVMTAPAPRPSETDEDVGDDLGDGDVDVEDARIGPLPNPAAVRQLLDDVRALQAESAERLQALETTR